VLDLALRAVGFRHADGFALRDVSFTAKASTCTAVVGAGSCGSTTLLSLIAGDLRPTSGDVLLGQRRANELRPKQRPLLFLNAELEVPSRWTAEHALIAAVRTRSLDRIDRHREFVLAAESWNIAMLLQRRLASLSSTEQTRVQLARVDLLRPGILLADRILERVNAADAIELADAFYRMLRIHGTTVLTVPASRGELAFADQVVVLANGTAVQSGSPAEVFSRPVGEEAAAALAEVDAIPIVIRGSEVESAIGSWRLAVPPFQGEGVALVRPQSFSVPRAGEDSDFVFGIEEAGFAGGRWHARGLVTGGVRLRVELPAETAVHKGRLLALRYDPSAFVLLPRSSGGIPIRAAGGGIPPMHETG
jgi:ABC-type sugar transport system ATPase subunit